MTTLRRLTPATLSVLWLTTIPAFAHVGLGQVETFSTGFFHPLGGIDHVLAMVAVGLYAASLGGSALWLVPLAFVGTMIVGGVGGLIPCMSSASCETSLSSSKVSIGKALPAAMSCDR